MNDSVNIETISNAAIRAVKELIGENSPMPEFKNAWFDSFTDISIGVITGKYTKKEAEKLAEARRIEMLKFIVMMFLKDDNEISNAYIQNLYKEIRAA